MKKNIVVILCLLFSMSGCCMSRVEAFAEAEYSIYYSEEDVSFYKHCYDVALGHMDKETELDPEGYYKRYATEHQSMPEAIKEREKQNWMLFVWPDEQDISRENAIVLSYAALEQLGGIERQMLSRYYTQAVLVDTDADKHVWRVWCMLALDHYDSAATEYEVFIDARSGEIIRFEVYEKENPVG